MKRLDPFELFHQRRKRRPLADVTGGKSSQNTCVPSRRFASEQQSNPGKPLRNISAFKQKLTKPSLGNISSWSKNYNVGKGGVESTSPQSTSSSTNKGTEKGTEKPAHKPIPLTNIRQFLPKKKPLIHTTEPRPKAPFSALSSRLWSGAPPVSTPSARYRLLSSLVDYNPAVHKSNSAVRSFCDSVKLGSSFAKAGSAKSASLLLPIMSDDFVVVSRVTKISPLLLAVTTSQDEDILLMNTQGLDVSAGSMLSLGDFHSYDIGGVSKKAYYKWQVL